jgi:hypothetical protein
MTRTDVHSPANLVTEDYEYVFCLDNDPEEGTPGWATFLSDDFVREIWDGLAKSPVSDRSIFQCHHCGARIRYVALLRHLPTSAIIAVGETCLENRFDRATSDFHAVRKQAQLDREAQRIKTAAMEQLATLDPDLVDCLAKKDPETFVNEFTQAARSHHIVVDIRRKLWLYGSVSVGQVNLVGKIILQEQERKVRQAEQDNDFGGAWKLTIKVETEDGVWIAWVSEPSALTTEVGDIVAMTATLTRSDDKPFFAFGKRPTKAVIVSTKEG